MLDVLNQTLGSILVFFYGLLDGLMSEGLALGFAIILLTIAINVLVFPLTLKQTRATRAFTQIQPEIKRIQKEYKDDPQEMQKRLLEVQRGAGATPGGCLLPLLVQLPIWWALFRVLRTPLTYIDPNSGLGVALQDDTVKTFFGMDLSVSPGGAITSGFVAALPYLITIVLMVATQYVQQWHATYGQERPAGQPGAGAQQTITKVMPLFIGFVSWQFPAGLILYWATSNLFRLGQQALIFKIDGRPTPVQSSDQGGEKGKHGADKTEKQSEGEPESNGKPQQGAASKRRRRRRR